MPLPDVTFFINGNDQYAYDYLVTLNMTDIGADAQEMRFSSNGVTWSPWYIFAATHQWDFRLYGGSTSHGQRFVFAQFKNPSGESSVNDSILLVELSPKIEYIGDPVQRNDEIIVDIPYNGIEQYPIGPSVDLIFIEYDVTGQFIGNEKKLSVKESDPNDTGITALQFTPDGFLHNLVWDVLQDVDADEYWATTKIRIKAHYGEYISDWFVSEYFTISTRDVPPDQLVGVPGKPGDAIKIEMSIFDNTGTPVDADSIPLVTSIKDPDGVEKVVTPYTMIQDGIGHYYYDYTTLQSDPVGQWQSIITYVINGVTYTKDAPFYLEDDYIVVTPTRPDSCTLYGTLYCENGDPMPADTEVLIFNDDLTDPGHFNPTRIGVVPIKAYTNSDGYFSVDVIKNSEVIIYIKDLNYKRRAKIPESTMAEFTTIILNLPTPPRDKFGNRII